MIETVNQLREALVVNSKPLNSSPNPPILSFRQIFFIDCKLNNLPKTYDLKLKPVAITFGSLTDELTVVEF